MRTVSGELAEADLHTDQDWPTDVQAEVDATWAAFTDRFDRHRTCFDDVEVTLVRSLDDGDARYRPADRTIEILIPTSPRRFRESLVHELAHHVERTCSRHATLRQRLGFDDWASWTSGEEWELVPSERWAEVVVQLVNGERVRFARAMGLEETWVAPTTDWLESG